MRISNVLAPVAVRDFDTAVRWHERLLGSAAGRNPMQREPVAEWQLTPGGWIQVVADPERSGSSLMTLAVDGVESLAHELDQSRIAVGPPSGRPGVVQTVTIADPKGTAITLAEDLGAGV